MAAEFASQFGLTPDPWQQLVLDDWMRYGRDGKWSHRNCGLSVPRQNGKNALLEVRELFGAVMLGECILHTAHEVKTAKKHFRRLQHFFGKQRNDPQARYPELNKLVSEVRRVNGEEAIILKDSCWLCRQTLDLCGCGKDRDIRPGGSIEMAARSKSSGRGFTVDLVVFDEAQQLDDDAIEALSPTKSSAPSGNPQTIYTGTPPGPQAAGEVFTRQRRAAARKGVRGRCWHEWSKVGRLGTGPGEIDVHDLSHAYDTNPSLGSRLQESVVTDEMDDMSEGGYARERLGMWASDTPDIDRVIPESLWNTLISAGPVDGTPPTALAVDMWFDGVLAIAGCWRVDDERVHVELVSVENTTDPLAAVDWLVERAARKRIPVVVDVSSPANQMVTALERQRVRVKKVHGSGADMGAACGLFVTDAKAARLSHTGQRQLDDALAGAKKRPIRDAGSWGWDRKDRSVNLSPLVAATLARFGASTVRARTGQGRSVGDRSMSSSRRAVVV